MPWATRPRGTAANCRRWTTSRSRAATSLSISAWQRCAAAGAQPAQGTCSAHDTSSGYTDTCESSWDAKGGASFLADYDPDSATLKGALGGGGGGGGSCNSPDRGATLPLGATLAHARSLDDACATLRLDSSREGTLRIERAGEGEGGAAHAAGHASLHATSGFNDALTATTKARNPIPNLPEPYL